MAVFQIAHRRTALHEGGYVFDPADPGGETWCGISKHHHPDWNGWSQVELWKRAGKPMGGPFIETLDRLTSEFYRQQYWTPLSGDRIPSQRIADELFDTAVNMGVATAARFLQEGLNILNRNGTLYPDLTVDGKLGNKTLSALRRLLELGEEAFLLIKAMNILQGARYLDILRRDPSQERFARGWLARASLDSGRALDQAR